MENNIEIVKSIIRFYNTVTSSSAPCRSRNQAMVSACLAKVGNDPVIIKNHIRKWASEHRGEPELSLRLEECLDALPIPESVSVTPAAPAEPQPNPFADSLALITNAVASLVAQTQAEKIETEIMGSVQTEVRNFIKSEYGTIEKKVVTVVDGVKREVKGTLHEKFDRVLKCVSNKIPVYLVGPAGSGKNYLCKQVADALGLKFYFTNAVTQEYKLTGFTDANGNYQPTQFYKAFTEGGLFMLDEMDASIPEVLVILNAAIANGYFDFPAPIGYKEAHPDFRVVAAGNTTGHGADYEYVGRNQLDGASLNRFAIIEVGYSTTIEDSLSDDKELINFCRDFRTASKKVGVNVVVSYRNMSYLDTLVKLLPAEEAIEMCLVKDLEKDDVNLICNEMPSSKYKTALRKVWETM